MRTNRDKFGRMKSVEVARIVATSPAPCFYITAEEALRKYSIFKRSGGLKCVSSDLRTQMYMEIFARYEQKLKEDIKMSFKYDIMEKVINSEAPRFYISEESAGKFYYRAMSNKRKRIRERA